MSPTAALPRTILDLPMDVLTEICDIVNYDNGDVESPKIINPQLLNLLLAHSMFLESARTRVSKHQHYFKTYTAVTIDTTYGSIYDEDWIEKSSAMVEIPFDATFDSAVMMLIALHRDEVLAAYVTSVTYTVSPDVQVQGANRREAAPEEFGNSQDSLDAWTDNKRASGRDTTEKGSLGATSLG